MIRVNFSILTSGAIIGTIIACQLPQKYLNKCAVSLAMLGSTISRKYVKHILAKQGKQVQAMPSLKHLGRATLV